jgi:hypothetical protein
LFSYDFNFFIDSYIGEFSEEDIRGNMTVGY